eukprot:NODE_665_length_4905_cov_0.461506.p2 type:complete len:408 gc:universal NODE_665_length_4905_cov_0.461506:3612-2389(-)
MNSDQKNIPIEIVYKILHQCKAQDAPYYRRLPQFINKEITERYLKMNFYKKFNPCMNFSSKILRPFRSKLYPYGNWIIELDLSYRSKDFPIIIQLPFEKFKNLEKVSLSPNYPDRRLQNFVKINNLIRLKMSSNKFKYFDAQLWDSKDLPYFLPQLQRWSPQIELEICIRVVSKFEKIDYVVPNVLKVDCESDTFFDQDMLDQFCVIFPNVKNFLFGKSDMLIGTAPFVDFSNFENLTTLSYVDNFKFAETVTELVITLEQTPFRVPAFKLKSCTIALMMGAPADEWLEYFKFLRNNCEHYSIKSYSQSFCDIWLEVSSDVTEYSDRYVAVGNEFGEIVEFDFDVDSFGFNSATFWSIAAEVREPHMISLIAALFKSHRDLYNTLFKLEFSELEMEYMQSLKEFIEN